MVLCKRPEVQSVLERDHPLLFGRGLSSTFLRMCQNCCKREEVTRLHQLSVLSHSTPSSSPLTQVETSQRKLLCAALAEVVKDRMCSLKCAFEFRARYSTHHLKMRAISYLDLCRDMKTELRGRCPKAKGTVQGASDEGASEGKCPRHPEWHSFLSACALPPYAALSQGNLVSVFFCCTANKIVRKGSWRHSAVTLRDHSLRGPSQDFTTSLFSLCCQGFVLDLLPSWQRGLQTGLLDVVGLYSTQPGSGPLFASDDQQNRSHGRSI